jgi:Leucine rich repeat
VPEAVFHLMRNTALKSCDLSGNLITKIPPKIAVKFSLITELNLSNNQMAKLPDELADMSSLQILDISHNSFLSLPMVVFKMAKLRKLLANNNAIIGEWCARCVVVDSSNRFFRFSDIDADEMVVSDSLELVDLRKNPLTPMCREMLKNANVTFHIELSERVREDWEDLTI